MLDQRGRAHSQDLRERVFATSDDGERVGEVAELLRVSVAYVSKALMLRCTTGETTARAQRGHKVPSGAVLCSDPRIRCRAGRYHDRGTADVAVGDTPGGSERRADLAHVEAAWPVAQKKSLRGAEQDRPTSPRPARNGARTSRS